LEILVDDEETTLAELNRVSGEDQHIFSRVKILENKLPITANPREKQEEVIVENE
jgi:hypothetical protein